MKKAKGSVGRLENGASKTDKSLSAPYGVATRRGNRRKK